ncbi:MAG TPA: hypothetical protein VNO54_15285 [Streptosporangiaceae bacterium]|nr:hypothetical protein [Streptosporangiaceae bacterium]
MSSDPAAEIRASVGAHADLGPGYEDAVAEGLVERIGAEIDKRIDARFAQTGAAGYPGYQGYLGPMLPPGYQLGPPPVRPSQVGTRNVATTITALGSMAMGVAATAIVAHTGSLGGQGFIILLIWVAIAIINVAYARRP